MFQVGVTGIEKEEYNNNGRTLQKYVNGRCFSLAVVIDKVALLLLVLMIRFWK
jgi:hypothetical protein